MGTPKGNMDDSKAIAMGKAFEEGLHAHWQKKTQVEAAAPPRKPGAPHWKEEDFEPDLHWGEDDHIRL